MKKEAVLYTQVGLQTIAQFLDTLFALSKHVSNGLMTNTQYINGAKEGVQVRDDGALD